MASRSCVVKFVDATRMCSKASVPFTTPQISPSGTAALSTVSSKVTATGAASATGAPVPPPPGTSPSTPPAPSPPPPGPKKGGSSILPLATVLAAVGAGYWAVSREYPEHTAQYSDYAKEAARKLGVDPKKLSEKLPESLRGLLFSRGPEKGAVDGGAVGGVATEPEQQVEGDAGWQLEPVGGRQREAETLDAAAADDTDSCSAEEPGATGDSSSSSSSSSTEAAAQEPPQTIDASALNALLTEALSSPPFVGPPAPPTPTPSVATPSAADIAAGATAVLAATDAAEADRQSAEAAVHMSEAAAAVAAAGPPAASPLAVPLPPAPEVITPLPKAEHPLHALGVSVDLTPGGLVRYAVEHGYGAGQAWGDYSAQHRQAKADAAAIAVALQQAEAFLTSSISKEREVVEALKGEVAEVRNRAQEAVGQLQEVVKQQGQVHEGLLQRAVRQAGAEAAVAAAQAGGRERLERVKALDELRLKTGALEAALQLREGEAATAVGAGRLTVALGAIQNAVQQGRAFAGEVAAAGAACQGDELVATIVQALPKEVAARGVATREQLGGELRGLLQPLGELCQLPEEGPKGMLIMLAARLASKLKVSEKSAVAVLGYDPSSASPTTALAAAEHLVEQGKLLEAADALETGLKGTAAAAAAAAWVAAARERATVEVSLKLLHSHSAAVMASLS